MVLPVPVAPATRPCRLSMAERDPDRGRRPSVGRVEHQPAELERRPLERVAGGDGRDDRVLGGRGRIGVGLGERPGSMRARPGAGRADSSYSRGVIFKRVGDGRPTPTTGCRSRAWAAVPPRQVRLDELVTTKDTLQLAALLDEDSTFYGDLFAHVVEWRGELYLEDGLHRALRAALQQRHVLHARVHVGGGLMRAGQSRTAADAGRRWPSCCSSAAAWGVVGAHRAVPAARPTAPTCVDTDVQKGEKVFRRPGRRSSVFNAGDRAGLAGRTMKQLDERGLRRGRQRQRARTRPGCAAGQVWTTEPDDPAVRLVASQLGPRHPRGRPGKALGPGRRRRRRRRLHGRWRRRRSRSSRARHATICSPPATS